MTHGQSITDRLGRFDIGKRFGSLYSGTIVLMAINVAAQLMTFIAHALVARMVGETQFGEYALAFTWATVLLVPSVLGFDLAVVRFVSGALTRQDTTEAHQVFRVARRTTFRASLLIAFVGITVSFLIPVSSSMRITLAIGLTGVMILWTQFKVQQGLLQAAGLVQVASLLVGVLRPAIWLGLTWVFISGTSTTRLASLTIGAHSVALAVVLLLAIFVRRRRFENVTPYVQPSLEQSRLWRRTAISLAAVAGLHLLLQRIDVIVVGAVAGSAAAGVYSASSLVSGLAIFGLTAAGSVAAPRIASLHEAGNFSELEKLARQTAVASIAVSVVIGLILAASSGLVLSAFGPEFVQGRGTLLVLAAGHGAASIVGPIGFLLSLTGHERKSARILGVILVANLIFNYPAVLVFGPIGAAFVTAALNTVKSLWMWQVVRKSMSLEPSPLRRPIQVDAAPSNR